MKISFITIFLLTLATNLLANKIDNLKTDEDVESFIHKQDKKFKNFYLVSVKNLYYSTLNQRIADSLKIKPWQKVDFDNNGLTDLLVYGIWDGKGYLLAVIDEGGKITFRSLNRGFFDNAFFPLVVTVDAQVFLILHHSCDICSEGRIIKTDTLIYKYGDFIEPTFNSTFYKIEKIEYSTTMCFGTCPVFELEINPDRTARYNALQYNDREGKFKTTIDRSSFNAIITLLNYVDFPKLKDTYEVNWTDDQTCTLKIAYNNGKIKTITDYGKIGTNGLRMVYNKFFALRENQLWKKY